MLIYNSAKVIVSVMIAIKIFVVLPYASLRAIAWQSQTIQGEAKGVEFA